MPKVALCYWGICRSTDKTLESIKKYIYTPLKNNNYDYDVFLHTFSINRTYKNKRSDEPPVQLNNDLYKLLEPKDYIIEDQDTVDQRLNLQAYRTHGDPWNSQFETFDNHIRALYSLYKVTQLYKKQISNYDFVIYLRPDVLFLNELDISWFNILDKPLVLTPDFHLDLPMNDRFAIARPNVGVVYGERFTTALAYSKLKPLHSETFLHTILTNAKIKIIDIAIRFRRVRATGKEIDDGTLPPVK